MDAARDAADDAADELADLARAVNPTS